MDSDDYFEDEIDSNILHELDAMEAAALQPSASTSSARESHRRKSPASTSAIKNKHDTSDSFDLTFDFDESELRKVDMAIQDTFRDRASTSNQSRPPTSTKGMQQTTLFGDVLQKDGSIAKPDPGPARLLAQKTKPSSRSAFGQQAPQTKKWDQTAFAKTGWKIDKSKSRDDNPEGQAEGNGSDEDEVDANEFEQFPPPVVTVGYVFFNSLHRPPPMKLKADMLEAKHWIYPLNQPKREYQFNIVKRCLWDNTLVALPTGLGKTFIAGVVMLNFYRWFPEGKVVFVAPTKPLVAQQIEACHMTCGIPGHDATELTGNIARSHRSRMWREKRIFYMTPQTLINDLTTENCDPRDIILLVIDEAHKGTGNYAYAQVVRYLMAKNSHFRVLALTATPGSTSEAVQDIIDALHISRIEIRDERSIDLRDYMFKKEVKKHIILMNEDINKIQAPLKKLMINILKPLNARGVIEPLDVVKLHPYRATAAMQRISGPRNAHNRWAYAPLSSLSFLARAMGYLMEASVEMCYTHLQGMTSDAQDDDSGKGNTKKSKIRSDPVFQQVMSELEAQRSRGFSVHPKMETLKTLLVQHFGARMAEEGVDGSSDQTRAMVFVTYRDCVDEIVEMLNSERPLLRATRFVGQSSDKHGKKGIAQREQLEVIKKFKDGEYNVLVSTSIGEEGLDIGEVDMIVCYDAQKTPIRMLQRVGRTGRRRTGYVHVLLAEHREETNWDKAQDTYGELQKTIVRGDQLELYGDVERLLPDHAKPELLEKKMAIEPYLREDPTIVKRGTGQASESLPKKRRRNDDIMRNIPEGASTSFISAAILIKKNSKKSNKRARQFDPLAAEDDSTDLELESGLLDMRRTTSTPARPKGKGRGASLRKSSTMVSKDSKQSSRTKRKNRSTEQMTSTQFSSKGIDDSDDMEIEQDALLGPSASSRPDPRPRSRSRLSSRSVALADNATEAGSSAHRPRASKRAKRVLSSPSPDSEEVFTPRKRSKSAVANLDPDVMELSSSLSTHPFQSHQNGTCLWTDGRQSSRTISSQSPKPHMETEDKSMAWLLDDEEDTLSLRIQDSSPLVPKVKSHAAKRALTPIDIDDDIEVVEGSPSASGAAHHLSPADDSHEVIENTPAGPSRATRDRSSSSFDFSSSPLPAEAKKFRSRSHVPPRDVPSASIAPGIDDEDFPETSFIIRPGAGASKRRILSPPSSDDAWLGDPPTSSHHRLHKRSRDSSAPKARGKRRLISNTENPLFDVEAVHSGDDISEGSSHAEDDVETEFDKQFIKNGTQTQVSPSYDQRLAYRQSLFTQVPDQGDAPTFAHPPARGRPFAARESLRRHLMVSSSPRGVDDVPDEYAIGSFVVADDADISYSVPSSDL